MATRQYIGARYVPKFVGPYDPTQAYDALDVVDNGSGTTYIARIQTPPNTPLTDTTHWLVYGSSSGAILDLQGRVTTLENDNNAIKASILSIGGQVEDNTGDISDLNDDVSAINTEVNFIKKTAHAVKKIIIIGDSYCTRSDQAVPIGIRDGLGVSAANCCISVAGSTGFAALNDQNQNFRSLLVDANGYFSNNNDVSHIIVVGGANDAAVSNESSVRSAMVNFCSYAAANFPNATVYVGFIGYNTGTSSIRKYGDMAMVYQKKATEISNAIYLRNVEFILHNRRLIGSDAVHPNDDGNVELIRQIPRAILEGECDVYYYMQVDAADTGLRNVYELIHNDVTQVWINNCDRKTYSPVIANLTNTGVATICSLRTGMVTGSYYQDCGVPAVARIFYNNGTNNDLLPTYFFVEGGDLKFRNCEYNKQFANVNALDFVEFCIVFNTLYC